MTIHPTPSPATLLTNAFRLAGSSEFTRRRYEPDETLIEDGSSLDQILIIEMGWACAQKALASGRRQIVNFLVPGDWAGLGTIGHPTAYYGVVAATPLSAVTFKRATFVEILKSNPQLLQAVTTLIEQQVAILSEHMLSIGQRSAYQRVMHTMLELSARLAAVGLASGDRFKFPLTQVVLADAMGLSPVHLNRTLSRLRRDDLLKIEAGHAHIVDGARAMAVSGFDEAYLHLAKDFLRPPYEISRIPPRRGGGENRTGEWAC